MGTLRDAAGKAAHKAALILEDIVERLGRKAHAGGIGTPDLVQRVFRFCEVYSGKVLYPYQEQLSKRIIRSVLENDGAELTALFARQSGKTETVAVTVGGLMILLPQLANMPMFLDDRRLQMFRDGLWVGIFAPSLRQSQITYNRMRSRLQCREAIAVLEDPDFRLVFTTSNGQTVALSNGSFCTSISASDSSNIEGESFKFIICEESQDISNFKIRKCLSGDTRVLMSDGSWERLDALVARGEGEVACYDPEMRGLTARTPREFYDNGVQDVYEVVLDNGESIKATINHQFYTLNSKTRGEKCKFRTLREIVDSLGNDRPLRVGVPDAIPYFAADAPLDYEKGLLVGYFLGDGCLVGTPKFMGSRNSCYRLLSLARLVCGGGVGMTEYAFHPDSGMAEVCYSTPGNRKGSNPLTRFFKEFGVYGLKGSGKRLPEGVFSREFYKGLIEGLVETDGCVESPREKPVISFASISEVLAGQVKDALLRFGIHATHFVKPNGAGLGAGRSKPLHVLNVKSVEDVARFAEAFSLFEKQPRLDEARATAAGRAGRERSKNYPDTMRFCRVKSVTYAGRERTYCLSVEGRNFIANGMISSNSIHPMGAAYNATICKIGTPTTYKGDFYDAIQRNKAEYESGKLRLRSHFEYNYKVVQKYNPKYLQYVEKEKKRLGEDSDEFQMSYCVSPDTRLLTADLRWVRAGDVERGDALVGFDEEKPKRYGQRKFRRSIVEDVGLIVRPCYEVTLADGTRVVCSKEHQWLVFTAGSRTQWKRTEDLVPTDRVYRVCKPWDDLPQDYRLGYLAAAFDGDRMHPRVESLRFLGDRVVVPIRTSTRTYVAEGLASHNCLQWVISRGMFVDYEKVERTCGDRYLERVGTDHHANHVMGIDIGGGSARGRKDADSTVCTVVEVDWDSPVLMESTRDEETGEDIVYAAYNTYIKDWLEISPEVAEDYEEQYSVIMDYISRFRLSRIVVDATREASLGQRIQANVGCEVVPFVFSSKSKSELYKTLQTEINTGRARIPMGMQTTASAEYQKFAQQLSDLQKTYSGSYLVVAHPDERGAHDDYPDSWALAVWGSQMPGAVDNTETSSRSEALRQRGGGEYARRNRKTARRR